jgi:hypothetical protein
MRQEMSQIQTIIWVTLHTRSCKWEMNKPNPIKKVYFRLQDLAAHIIDTATCVHGEVWIKFVKEE